VPWLPSQIYFSVLDPIHGIRAMAHMGSPYPLLMHSLETIVFTHTFLVLLNCVSLLMGQDILPKQGPVLVSIAEGSHFYWLFIVTTTNHPSHWPLILHQVPSEVWDAILPGYYLQCHERYFCKTLISFPGVPNILSTRGPKSTIAFIPKILSAGLIHFCNSPYNTPILAV
jgi:hypothetical protein